MSRTIPRTITVPSDLMTYALIFTSVLLALAGRRDGVKTESVQRAGASRCGCW
jgi:hypothetical protein